MQRLALAVCIAHPWQDDLERVASEAEPHTVPLTLRVVSLDYNRQKAPQRFGGHGTPATKAGRTTGNLARSRLFSKNQLHSARPVPVILPGFWGFVRKPRSGGLISPWSAEQLHLPRCRLCRARGFGVALSSARQQMLQRRGREMSKRHSARSVTPAVRWLNHAHARLQVSPASTSSDEATCASAVTGAMSRWEPFKPGWQSQYMFHKGWSPPLQFF